jgi:drug/metabolite transporter (DMT)-like permease
MPSTALLLVLAAAASHAAWNLLAKRAGGGAPFVWLCAAAGAILWAPVAVAVAVISAATIEPGAIPLLAVTAVLHTAYYLALQASYRRGDLSVVYPVARGTGALLAVTGAVVLLGERPTWVELSGAALIAIGIVALSGWTRAGTRSPISALWLAVGTGAVISAYTVWDGWLVTEHAMPALLLVWAADLGRVAVLAPVAVRRSAEVREVYRMHRREIVSVALLAPVAYMLVLLALRFAPLSYVAATREVSILIGVVAGWRLLGEGDVGRRVVAAVAVIAGVVLATLG